MYSDPTNDNEPSSQGDPYAQINWTSDQLARMEHEWRRLQRAFAYHPHVTLTPLSGDPPSAYQVDFRLTTVIVNPRTSQLEYVANATVHILLPPGFPHQAPTVKPLTPIFHPNVSYEGVYLENLWHPNETLLGLIRKVGDLLAYRNYDVDYAVNPAATDWLIANQSIVPIDQQANLSPTAGGEPLDRIVKYGPQSLESMKQSVVATQTALLSNSSLDHATLRDYAQKTRMALKLFLEKDVPASLQRSAGELAEAARELVSMLPLYEYVREQRRELALVKQNARQLAGSKAPLAAEVDQMMALVDAGDPEEPMIALKLIPPAEQIQPIQFSLPKLLAEAQKRRDDINAGLDSVQKKQPPALVPTDSILGQRLDRELGGIESELRIVREEATSVLAACEPIIRRAASEAEALEVAAHWREYLDMAEKAKQMERRIREWGAEGLQAFYIENPGGKYGPFQFEQPVDLGTGNLFLRNPEGKTIELWDPTRIAPRATNQTGVMAVALPTGQETVDANGNTIKETIPTRFSLTERCDDLLVMLDYLRRSAIETVKKFGAYDGKAQSWAGKICRVLARPEVKKSLEEELARAARRWRYTIVDLAALSPWKERLATYFLLHRANEQVPALVESLSDARKRHAVSKQKVDEIMTKCGRDLDTGALIVPPNLSRSYDAELKLQEQCAATVKAGTARLKSLVAQLTNRLQNPKLLGKGDVVELKAVPALPETLATLPLADGQIGHLIVPLEELLNMPLGGPRPDENALPMPAEMHHRDEQPAAEEYAADDATPEPQANAYDPSEAGSVAEAAEGDAFEAVPASEAESAGQFVPVAVEPEAASNEVYLESEEEWVVEEEITEHGEENDDQSDLVFGFDTDPTPPPGGRTS